MGQDKAMNQDKDNKARNPKADPRLGGTQKQRNMQKDPQNKAAKGGRTSRGRGGKQSKA